MSFSLRRRRALRAAARAGAQALLVTHLPDVRYLCGFTGTAGALALGNGRARLFTDGRYRDQAKAEAAGVDVAIESRPAATAGALWLNETASSCAFDAEHTTVAGLDTMRKALPAASRRSFFLATEALVARLREIKDADEVQHLRSAALLGCTLFDRILTSIKPGVRESEIALTLEQEARRLGAEAMSFETIVASGERSALPHGRASAVKLPRRGLITLDFGVILNGYCSDMTRTVSLGKPRAEERSVYDSVLEAQLAAVSLIRATVVASTVDSAARSILKRDRLDSHFVHSTGHGVGLEIHEGPRLAATATAKLEAGMVVTVEPGVYLPGRFGVRIEDMVLVTSRGGEVLTPSTRVLIEL